MRYFEYTKEREREKILGDPRLWNEDRMNVGTMEKLELRDGP